MKHIDLFSGIGGFSLAASWVWGNEHEIVTFCEINEFCQKVLRKHWPNVPCVSDIHNLRGEKYGTVDLITGGFPCQPFSTAGNRQGEKDNRHLWPEMFRVIKEVKPRWVLAENVAGIVSMVLDQMLTDLESESYETQAIIIPACAVNALHRRDRIWIIANSNDTRNISRFNNLRKDDIRIQEKSSDRRQSWNKFKRCHTNNIKERYEFADGGNVDGLSCRMDEIRALGNAIVPQVVAQIMYAIKRVDDIINNS